MKRLMFALACCAAFLAGCAGTTPGRPHSGIERSGGDQTVRPQDDLFRNVNGTWLKTDRDPGRQGLHRLRSRRSTTRSRSSCAACVEAAAKRATTPTRAASATSTRASWTRLRSSAPASRRSPASSRRSTRSRTPGELAARDGPAGAARRRRAVPDGHRPGRTRRDALRAACSPRTASACPIATTTSSPTTPSSRAARSKYVVYLRRLLAAFERERRRRGDAPTR